MYVHFISRDSVLSSNFISKCMRCRDTKTLLSDVMKCCWFSHAILRIHLALHVLTFLPSSCPIIVPNFKFAFSCISDILCSYFSITFEIDVVHRFAKCVEDESYK